MVVTPIYTWENDILLLGQFPIFILYYNMQNVTNEGKLGEGYMRHLCTTFALLYYYYESVIISKLKDKKLWVNNYCYYFRDEKVVLLLP